MTVKAFILMNNVNDKSAGGKLDCGGRPALLYSFTD